MIAAVGILAKVSIVEALVNVVLSVILVGPYGLTGVALGTAIPLTFLSFFMTYLANGLVKSSILVYMREVGLVYGVCIGMQIAAWFIVQEVEIKNYTDLILTFLAIYPLEALLILFIVFPADERRYMKETSLRALGIKASV